MAAIGLGTSLLRTTIMKERSGSGLQMSELQYQFRLYVNPHAQLYSIQYSMLVGRLGLGPSFVGQSESGVQVSASIQCLYTCHIHSANLCVRFTAILPGVPVVQWAACSVQCQMFVGSSPACTKIKIFF